MEFALFYTAIGIVTYFLSAWVLERIEIARGKRFAYRNYIFFVIIFAIAYAALYLISSEPEPSTPEQQQSQSPTDQLDQ